MPPRSLPFRYAQLMVGLAVCAVGVWLTLRAGLGVSPWDVLHAGLAAHLHVAFGTVVIGVGLVVLAVSLLLRVRPGIGTALNIVVIGWLLNVLLPLPVLRDLARAPYVERVGALLLGTALLGLGCAMYVGAHLGEGPRDGLMVALHDRTGLSIGRTRFAIEAAALGAGWLLGGPVGIGTLIAVVGIGPAVQLGFTVLRQTPRVIVPQTA